MTPQPHAHSQSNSNGFNVQGWPKWAQIIFVIGPTAAIALYLVYQNTNRGAVQWDRIESRIEAHAVFASDVANEQAATTAALIKAAEQDRAQNRSLILLVRQVCVNTSKNDEQRVKCTQ